MVEAGIVVAARLVAAVARHLGADHPSVARARRRLYPMAIDGLLNNVIRVDSFGLIPTGDPERSGRTAIYVRHMTARQRASDIKPYIFVDLDRADDVSYILAERDELYCAYGAEPVSLYGKEYARAADDAAIVRASE